MANHKRRRPKNRRAGCLMCKPWKANGFGRRRRLDGEGFAASRAWRAAEFELASYWREPRRREHGDDESR